MALGSFTADLSKFAAKVNKNYDLVVKKLVFLVFSRIVGRWPPHPRRRLQRGHAQVQLRRHARLASVSVQPDHVTERPANLRGYGDWRIQMNEEKAKNRDKYILFLENRINELEKRAEEHAHKPNVGWVVSDDNWGGNIIEKIFRTLRDSAYDASANLAEEKAEQIKGKQQTQVN